MSSIHACTIHGFPTVQLVNRNGHPLPTHPQRMSLGLTDIPDRQVTLRRDRPGRFLVIYRFIDGRGRACRPAPHAIRVRLPGQSQVLTVPVDRRGPQLRVFTPCGGDFILSPIGI